MMALPCPANPNDTAFTPSYSTGVMACRVKRRQSSKNQRLHRWHSGWRHRSLQVTRSTRSFLPAYPTALKTLHTTHLPLSLGPFAAP